MRDQTDRAFYLLDLLANQPNGYRDQYPREGRHDLGPNIDRVRPITLAGYPLDSGDPNIL